MLCLSNARSLRCKGFHKVPPADDPNQLAVTQDRDPLNSALYQHFSQLLSCGVLRRGDNWGTHDIARVAVICGHVVEQRFRQILAFGKDLEPPGPSEPLPCQKGRNKSPSLTIPTTSPMSSQTGTAPRQLSERIRATSAMVW